MSIALVVFDIAGTTVSDNGNINDFFRKTFLNAGITDVDPYDVNDVMGYRKKEAIEIIVEKYKPGFEKDHVFIDSIHEDFTKQMVAYYETCKDLQPLPFAEKVFQKLHDNNIKVALNTGFTKIITAPILKRLGWDKASFIDQIICSDEVPEGRPHPFMIEKLMERVNVTFPEDVAKIGDTRADIEEGLNAGCGMVIGITTGAFAKEDLIKYHPDYVIDSLQELLPLIL